MLTKSTEHALRALVFIQLQNVEDKRPGVAEVAEGIKAPKAFLAKILQTLTKHNLLDSARGRGGGFFFNGNQADISLYDVINVMEGDGSFHNCGFGFKNCTDESPCPIHHKYIKMRDEFQNIAKTETIESLSERILEGKAVLNSMFG